MAGSPSTLAQRLLIRARLVFDIGDQSFHDGREAAQAEDGCGDLLGPARPGHLLDAGDGIVDGIVDSLELDLVAFDDREGGPGVSVARKTHTAGIEHHHIADLEVELDVRVAHADDVGFHVVHALGPHARGL